MASLWVPFVLLLLTLYPVDGHTGRRLQQLTTATPTPTATLTPIPTSTPTLTGTSTRTRTRTGTPTITTIPTATSTPSLTTIPTTTPEAGTNTSTPTATPTKRVGKRRLVLSYTPVYLELNYTFSALTIVQVPSINTNTDMTVNFTCDANTTQNVLSIIEYVNSNAGSHSSVCVIPKMIYTNCSSWTLPLSCGTASTSAKFTILATGTGDIFQGFTPKNSSTSSTNSSDGSNSSLLYLLFLLLLLVPIILLYLAWIAWEYWHQEPQVVVDYTNPWPQYATQWPVMAVPVTPIGYSGNGLPTYPVVGLPPAMSTMYRTQTMSGKDTYFSVKDPYPNADEFPTYPIMDLPPAISTIYRTQTMPGKDTSFSNKDYNPTTGEYPTVTLVRGQALFDERWQHGDQRTYPYMDTLPSYRVPRQTVFEPAAMSFPQERPLPEDLVPTIMKKEEYYQSHNGGRDSPPGEWY